MLGLFYRIWVDCIIRAKLQPANKGNWKVLTLVVMTTAMSIFLLFIIALLEKFVIKKAVYNLNFLFLPKYLKELAYFGFLFFLPCFIINYALIFRGKRYKILLEKYPYSNGKLFLGFFLISVWLPVICLLVGILFFK